MTEWQQRIAELDNMIWTLDIEIAKVLVNLYFSGNYPKDMIL